MESWEGNPREDSVAEEVASALTFYGEILFSFLCFWQWPLIGFQSLLTFKGSLWRRHTPALQSLQRGPGACLPSRCPNASCTQIYFSSFLSLCFIFLHFKTWGFLFLLTDSVKHSFNRKCFYRWLDPYFTSDVPLNSGLSISSPWWRQVKVLNSFQQMEWIMTVIKLPLSCFQFLIFSTLF